MQLEQGQFGHVSALETTKLVWDWLPKVNEGVSTQRESRISVLRNIFNRFKDYSGVRTPILCHIDLACNTSYHFAASCTVFPRVSPYNGPGPFAPFGSCI